MPRRKSALVALKNLEKSYEQERRALLRKAEDEMAARVQKIVDDLSTIAKDFPTVVSNAVATLVLAPAERKATPMTVVKAPAVVSSEGEAAGRFRAMGVRAHRKKLGLSQEAYGKLVGVSSLTILKWETGKTKPREAQKAKWLAIRGLGKEEALRRLGMGTKVRAAPAAKAGGAKAVAPGRKKRGTFKQTAEEMILSLLNGQKALTTGQINAAWRKEGRAGSADNTLSLMTKAGKLKRAKVKEGWGSEYSAA